MIDNVRSRIPPSGLGRRRKDIPLSSEPASIAAAGTVTLGGDIVLNRLGLGTNRVMDSEASRQVLQEAIQIGINLIDTADVYTENASETAIGDTVARQPGVHVATKGGIRRGQVPSNTREYLGDALDASLRRLQVETIDLYYLHRVADDNPFADTVRFLKEQRDAGKIRHVGLSNVSVEQLQLASSIVEIAAVQVQYSPFERTNEAVLKYAEANGIVFVPWGPLKSGQSDESTALLSRIASIYDARPQQIALAWLLRQSPWMLPIPGTQSIEHLRANIASAELPVSDDDLQAISDASPAAS